MNSISENDEIQAIIEKAEEAKQQKGWMQACEILRQGFQNYPNSVPLMAKLGKSLRFCGGFAEAQEILQRAKSLAPDDYEVLYQLGIVLRREAHIWDAIVVHSHLVERFPDDANAQHVLANDQTVLGRPDKALFTLERLVSQFPERINYRISYCDALNRMGRYTEVITIIQEILANNPYFVDALLALAQANFGLMRTSQWITAAKQAHELNPNSALTNLWMHDVCLQDNNFEEAFDYLQQSLTSHPRFFQAHIAAGSLYWKAEREDSAEQWFKSAYEIAPWNGQAQGMLAQFMAETGRGEPLLEQLENQALALPYDRLPYYLGRMFFSTYQDYDRAVRFLIIAAEHAREDVDTRQLLGEAYILIEDYAQAIEELKQVVELCPELSKAWEELAYSYLQANRLSEAATAYARVVQHLPDNVNIRHGYGTTLIHLGELEPGITQLQQAAKLEPDNADILLTLAQALELAEQYSQAKEVALKALDVNTGEHEEIMALLERVKNQQ